ncbi:MAG TPA: 3-deoxy-D-manno-octulosonic acid transferase [Terriglobia bacterium]|jgi:3-deoxy-D-manno-octulosonic-acid transferase
MYFTYTLILALGLIVSFPYYLVRFRKYAPTLADRLGFLKLPQLRGSIWVHAVSVGEVKAVERLLERLREQFPDKPLVVSTATPAGQQLARDRRDIVDHTMYFPIDLPWCVQRTLDRVNPELMIIAETEIWPNFLKTCRNRGIRVVMINGRISDKSFARYRLIRHWLRRVFESYSIIGMQSELDRERIEAIGADPQKVTVFGNLKYDVAPRSGTVKTELVHLLEGWKKVWIAASTMPGEEEFILDAFRQVRTLHPDLRLVIAPRNPERFDAVDEMLKRSGAEAIRRTEVRISNSPAAPILLLDSIGELAALFHYATVVFVGGSLVARGGHNILEPARCGKPVVFGPHMENFRDITRLFLEANAAIQIGESSQLAAALSDVLSNPAKAEDIGGKALAVVERNSGATDRVLQVLEPIGASR